MFKSKKSTILLSLLLVLTLLLAACGGGGDNANTGTDKPEEVETGEETGGEEEPAGEADANATLTVADGSEPKSMDPHGTNDQPSSRVNVQMYDRLVEANEDMEIIPGLATEWSQDEADPRVWNFKLREGVKFHNGEDFKSSDVVFTFERMLDSPEVAHIIGAVEKVEADGDYGVIITTAEPFAPLLSHLSHTASSILSEKAVTEFGEDYAMNPVGTGPFVFEDFAAQDHVTLKRNEEYWGEKAGVETLIFRPINEGAQRRIGLETGEIDIAYDIEPMDREDIRNNDDLKLPEDQSLSTAYIGFNTTKAPFDNKEVRQAINYAVNVEDVINIALEGAGTPANGPINDRVFGYNPELQAYEYDVEKAKTMLADAGLADGFSTTVWLNDSPVRIKIAETIQANLQEVGVDVKIEQMEWAAYLDGTGRGDHEMFILGWVTVTGDADYGLYALYHSTQHGSAGNRTFYTNAEVDKYLDEGRTTVDPDARLAAYKAAQEIIVEDAPQIFLYFDNQNVGHQNHVNGFKLHPAGHHRMSSVTISK